MKASSCEVVPNIYVKPTRASRKGVIVCQHKGVRSACRRPRNTYFVASSPHSLSLLDEDVLALAVPSALDLP